MVSKSQSKKRNEYLVEDQPGFFIFCLGIGLAVFAGVVFRSVFSSDRIYTEVVKSAQKIHPSVQVDIGSAEISLSKNGFPRLALVIKDVRMSSSELCWGQPSLTVDEISLPLSILRWIKENRLFKTVVADNVELQIPQKLQGPCVSSLGETPKASPAKSGSTVVLVQNEKNESLQSRDIEELQIGQLTLKSDQIGPWPITFDNISMKEKSLDPRMIILTASSPLFREAKDFDYSSKANIQIEYTEFPERKILTHLIGQFREGHFAIQMQNRLDEGLYAYEFDFKHLPLSKVFTVLHRYGVAQNINPRQSWLSMKARSHGVFQQQDQETFEIKDFKLEGDVGELKTDLIEIEKLKPLKVKPFLMEAQKLDIEKAMEFVNQKADLNFLGERGEFFGRVEFFAVNELRLFGKHKGLEFIFSSHGQRRIQKVKELSLDASLRKDKLNISLNRFDVDEGQFDGEVTVFSDLKKNQTEVSLFAGTVSFSPEVQKLISRSQQMGSFKADIDVRWKDGKMDKALGQLTSDQLTVESLTLGNPVLDLKTVANSFQLVLKAKSLVVPKNLIQDSFVKDIFPESWLSSEGVSLHQLQSEFNFTNSANLKWKNVKALLAGGSEVISTKGSFDQQNIEGQIEIHTNTGQKIWKLKGTRDEPSIDNANP